MLCTKPNLNKQAHLTLAERTGIANRVLKDTPHIIRY